MKRNTLALCLVLLGTWANAQTVEPETGFVFGETLVTIRGTDLAPSPADCTSMCSGATCPVTVLFGTQEGNVETVTPDRITVYAGWQNEGTVDVTIRVPGRPDRVLPGAFRFAHTAIGSPSDYEAYLVPLTASLVGAHGSFWAVENAVWNGNDVPFLIPGTTCAGWPVSPPCSGPISVAPHESAFLEYVPRAVPGEGAYIYVPRGIAQNVAMELRVRDLNAAALSWGTEFPIVPVRDFRETVHLLDIPTDARYRATLRIYGGENPQRARVRVQQPNGSIVEELSVEMPGIVTIVPSPFPTSPSYAQLDPLTDKARAAAERVRIEVQSEIGAKIWAFVSLTNNAKQEVTAITPHP